MTGQSVERLALVMVLAFALSGKTPNLSPLTIDQEAQERADNLRALRANPSVIAQGTANERRLRPVEITSVPASGHHGHH